MSRRSFILSINTIIKLSEFHEDQNYILCKGCNETRVISSLHLPLCYACTDHPIVLYECDRCNTLTDENYLNEEDLCEECDIYYRENYDDMRMDLD